MTTPGSGPDFSDYRAFLWRDLALLLTTAIAWHSNATVPLTGINAVACGVLAGICALQLHEWGHIIGAFASRAAIYPPRRWWHPFMFSLDHTRTSREQFLAVSWPAFVATALYFAGFLWLLPRDNLAGQTALIMASITAGLTLLIELPLFIRVYLGHTVPPVELFQRPDHPQQ